jgi:NAD(P)-dependent dehydrogenase (short-subunit alcohol dehydrogenase family)
MIKKSVFITGAGAGIGRATALLFAKQGWFVGLYDRDEAAVQELAAQLGHDQAVAGRLDVTDVEGWQRALAAFFERAERLDVLVNNAGILYSGSFEDLSIQKHKQVIEVNLLGVLNGCHTALPYLKKTPNARVVNMSSASAMHGQANLSSYSASKFAVRGLTEALDNEWRAYGIRVVDVMPLFVQTAMVAEVKIGSINRLGIHLTPEDVAEAVLNVTTSRSFLTAIHTPVGLPSKLLYLASSLSPDRLNHWVNNMMAKS